MCVTFLTLGLMAQSAFSTSMSTIDVMERAVEAEKAAAVRRDGQNGLPSAEQKLEERQFVLRFNDLVKAMGAFSAKYQSNHVIDVKAVTSIRKAYKKLADAEPWFQLQK